ncbi:MAG: hypothetical protein AAF399_06680 [Bacteroidota bacterium]
MILSFRFPSEVSEDTIEDLTAYLQEQNLAGMLISRPEGEMNVRSMSSVDYLPIIKIVASSTVAAAAIKGMFDLIKKGMDLRVASKERQAEMDKAKLAAEKVECTIIRPDGSQYLLNFHPTDETERNKFLGFVNQAWQQ